MPPSCTFTISLSHFFVLLSCCSPSVAEEASQRSPPNLVFRISCTATLHPVVFPLPCHHRCLFTIPTPMILIRAIPWHVVSRLHKLSSFVILPHSPGLLHQFGILIPTPSPPSYSSLWPSTSRSFKTEPFAPLRATAIRFSIAIFSLITITYVAKP